MITAINSVAIKEKTNTITVYDKYPVPPITAPVKAALMNPLAMPITSMVPDPINSAIAMPSMIPNNMYTYVLRII